MTKVSKKETGIWAFDADLFEVLVQGTVTYTTEKGDYDTPDDTRCTVEVHSVEVVIPSGEGIPLQLTTDQMKSLGECLDPDDMQEDSTKPWASEAFNMPDFANDLMKGGGK